MTTTHRHLSPLRLPQPCRRGWRRSSPPRLISATASSCSLRPRTLGSSSTPDPASSTRSTPSSSGRYSARLATTWGRTSATYGRRAGVPTVTCASSSMRGRARPSSRATARRSASSGCRRARARRVRLARFGTGRRSAGRENGRRRRQPGTGQLALALHPSTRRTSPAATGRPRASAGRRTRGALTYTTRPSPSAPWPRRRPGRSPAPPPPPPPLPSLLCLLPSHECIHERILFRR
mmetsp:Transcript_25157/g.50164  ORF Transcript_25157/g.50164 Transcript_25157/m.50164 type:complete len:236 (+) Transcript_25157:376-1083(+)